MTETNKHVKQKVHKRSLPGKSRLKSLQEMDVAELYCFLAVVLCMGLVRKNTHREYCYKDTMFETPVFPVFSANHFCLLMGVLHFSSITDGQDHLREIRPVMETIQERFTALFASSQDLRIDESLMPWRGHLAFQQ